MQRLIKIQIYPKRFTVRLPHYMQELIDCFKTIEKRYWNAAEKLWSFPIESYDNLSNKIITLPSCMGYKIQVKDSKEMTKPKAIIIKNGSGYDLKFSKYIENFTDYKNIEGVEYLSNLRKFTLLPESLSTVISVLNSNGIQYEIMDEIIDFESENELKIASSQDTTTMVSPIVIKSIKNAPGKKRLQRKLFNS